MLVEDKYAMALTFNDTTVGHVLKFLSKITHLFLKLRGDLVMKITGKRRYSRELDQGGMELLVPTYLYQRMQKCTQNLKCLLKNPWNNTTKKIKEKEQKNKINK